MKQFKKKCKQDGGRSLAIHNTVETMEISIFKTDNPSFVITTEISEDERVEAEKCGQVQDYAVECFNSFLKKCPMFTKAVFSTSQSGKEESDDDKKQQALLDLSLFSVTCFSVKTLFIFKQKELQTVRDLVRLTRSEWIGFRSGGKRVLLEVEDFLSDNGLSWGMKV